MWQLAIDILWLLIGAIILCGVIYIVIYGVNTFIYQIPDKVQKGIWFIVFLLIIIAAISLLAGGGSSVRGPSFFRHSENVPVPGLTRVTNRSTPNLQGVLIPR